MGVSPSRGPLVFWATGLRYCQSGLGLQGFNAGDERETLVEKVVKTDAEWRESLDDLSFKVLRKHGTERAFTNDNFPKDAGHFTCKGCGTALFDQAHKFDSGTGWPSFYQPMNTEMVGEKEDRRLFMRRTEVHCARCDGHLGHVFPDGPQPTGLRYCINGASLDFKADGSD